MKLVISDAKTGKSYPKTVDQPSWLFGKKIGETIRLDEFGLLGFEAKITGGSDKQGFPMKNDMHGTARKKILFTANKKKGIKIRAARRGNAISNETEQLNLAITKPGTANLSEIFPQTEKKSEGKTSIKEEMIKQSLEVAGTKEAAEQMTKEEFKKGERKR